MGLDVYAVRPGDPAVQGHDTLETPVTWEWEPPEDLVPFEEIPRDLPEGLSRPSDDDDCTGFQGQIYRDWVNGTFGANLYQLHDPAQVRELADGIDGWLETARAGGVDKVELSGETIVPLTGIEALGRFVRVAADQGLWLFPDS